MKERKFIKVKAVDTYEQYGMEKIEEESPPFSCLIPIDLIKRVTEITLEENEKEVVCSRISLSDGDFVMSKESIDQIHAKIEEKNDQSIV